ncbi:MAG: sigma-70 family RNA polymerase sigma factor [Clostridiales bacterium]|nr:sigma-70 family RNA polymerase sigma factor [Clostridiales bacterium]MDY4036809.1 sigma-70 family RNA polymerase sigma factor [Candidatus Pseudoscilispira sp.]
MLLLAPCLALLETEEEEQSFSAFFERYHRLVLKKARDVVKTQEAAEDVGQEVFLYAAEHFEKFNGRKERDIVHYLRLCTQSRAINYLNKNRLEEPLDEEQIAAGGICVENAEQILLRHDTAARILTAVEKLPERYRAPLELRLEGESYDEIAALLSLPRDTVYKRIQRGYQHVRERLVREDDQ